MNGRVAAPAANRHAMMAPHGIYPTKDERWVSVAPASEGEWMALCKTAEHDEWLEDPRFGDLAARLQSVQELDETLANWTRQRDSGDLVARLQANGVAAVPVHRLEDQVENSYFAEIGAFTEVEHPLVGMLRVPGRPFRLSDQPWSPKAAPLLGHDNDTFWAKSLGYRVRSAPG